MKKYLFLFITSLLITGCDSNTSSTNITPGVADPFVTGNYWIYQNTYYSPDGAIDSTTIDSISITSTRLESGKKVIKYSDGHSERLIDSGIWHDEIGQLWYKFPAKTKDTLFYRGGVPTKVEGETFAGDLFRFVSKVSDVISVKAGTFSTYQYTLDITKSNTDTLASRSIDNFSPNIGLVKSELYTTSSLSPPLYIVSRKKLIRNYLH